MPEWTVNAKSVVSLRENRTKGRERHIQELGRVNQRPGVRRKEKGEMPCSFGRLRRCAGMNTMRSFTLQEHGTRAVPVNGLLAD